MLIFREKLLLSYFAATAAFLVLDYFGGINIRTAESLLTLTALIIFMGRQGDDAARVCAYRVSGHRDNRGNPEFCDRGIRCLVRLVPGR